MADFIFIQADCSNENKSQDEEIRRILDSSRPSALVQFPWSPRGALKPITVFKETPSAEDKPDEKTSDSPTEAKTTTREENINGDIPSPSLSAIESPVAEVKSAQPQTSAPKSWSSLFAGSNGHASSGSVNYQPVNGINSTSPMNGSTEAICLSTKDLIDDMEPNMNEVTYRVRGMVNNGNWCYITSILQALLACPPMYNFLDELTDVIEVRTSKQATKSVTSAMVWLVSQCPRANDPELRLPNGKVSLQSFRPGEPLDPIPLYTILSKLHRSTETIFMLGKQEDAEEFLSSLLNTLHEEIVATNNNNTEKPPAEQRVENGDTDNDWLQVGPKNKSVITRTNVNNKGQTAISRIFQGLLRSSLYTSTESSTLEPFFTIPLNIHSNASSLGDALHDFMDREEIEGYRCPDSGKPIAAARQIRFEQLPPILILHLKCFVYDGEAGSQKIIHNTQFEHKLIIEKEWISQQRQKQYRHELARTYHLFAAVYHHGNKASGGHYTTNIRYNNSSHSMWIQLDDLTTRTTSEQKVFQPAKPNVPYLLFYRKM